MLSVHQHQGLTGKAIHKLSPCCAANSVAAEAITLLLGSNRSAHRRDGVPDPARFGFATRVSAPGAVKRRGLYCTLAARPFDCQSNSICAIERSSDCIDSSFKFHARQLDYTCPSSDPFLAGELLVRMKYIV